MMNADKPNLNPEASALITMKETTNGEGRKKLWCPHCKNPWHTRQLLEDSREANQLEKAGQKEEHTQPTLVRKSAFSREALVL